MYASDLTHNKRADTVYANLLLKQQEFDNGNTIRVLTQKGGSDYSYVMNIEESRAKMTCTDVNYILGIMDGDPNVLVKKNFPSVMNIAGMTPISFSAIVDFSGNNRTAGGVLDLGYLYPNTLDDAIIPIPTGGYSFKVFGTDYGINNQIFWNTNNALLFGNLFGSQATYGGKTYINVPGNTIPAVLLGNYDRRINQIYTSTYAMEKYSIIKILVFFQNYYTDNSPTISDGKFEIRLIRELIAKNRQWIDVRVVATPATSGFAYNSGINYVGSPLNIDTEGDPIDPNKLSPYNITNGQAFINPCGTTFAINGPPAGTSFVFGTDSTGTNWNFYNNAYVNVV